MGLFPVVEITLESNSSWTQTLNCYGGIDVLNNNSSKQTVIKINNHYDVFAVTHTNTHACTQDRTSATTESLADPVRHRRKWQLAPWTDRRREKDDGEYTESVRSDVRSLRSSSALWRAKFLLADSNLYVKLTSLHRLGSDGLTGAVQLHWQFYSAITQLQGRERDGAGEQLSQL